VLNWRDITIISGIIGAIFGLVDGIFTVIRDNELLLSAKDTAIFALLAVLVYALFFIVLGHLYTGIVSLVTIGKRRGFRWNITPASVMGLFAFIVFVVLVGFYVNVLLLPEKLKMRSLVTNGVILVFGILLWVIVYRIIKFYTQRMKDPRRVFYRFMTFFATLGFLIVVVLVVREQLGERAATKIAPGEQKLNCILITIDTLRADYLSCYGHDKPTPNIDWLAENGVLFERAISQIPLTSPSHASLLTSTYPRQTEVTDNGYKMNDFNLSIAEVLSDSGFNTSGFVGAFPVASKLGFDQGFLVFNDYFSPYASISRLTLLRVLNHLGIWETKGNVQRRAEKVVNPFLKWLTSSKDQPFFSWVHLYDPHMPYDPPAPYDQYAEEANSEEERMIALYEGEIAYVDSQIGRITQALSDLGIMENTVIILTADHGEHLGDHGIYYDHGPYIYDTAIWVPLIIFCPGKIPSGLRITNQVELIDVAPTICDVLHVKKPQQMEGRSLLPLIAGLDEAKFGYSETFDEHRHQMACSTNAYKLIYTVGEDKWELYDLRQDSGELNNLAGEGLSVESVMARKLMNWDYLQPQNKGMEIDEETRENLRSIGYIQ